jgi:hypothetical protein
MSVRNIMLSEHIAGAASNPAPTFNAAGTAVNNGTGTGSASNVGVLPAGRKTGDILIMHLFADGSGKTFTISGTGWVQGDSDGAGGGSTEAWFWRIVDATETAPTISWVGGAKNTSIIYAFSGALASPIGAHINAGAGGSTNPMTSAALTTTAVNSLVIFLGGFTGSGLIPTPASYTICGTAFSTATPSMIAASEAMTASGGSSAAVSVTLPTATFWTTMEFELKAN